MPLLLSVALLASASRLVPPTIWIEGENPSSANVKYGTGAPGHADFLSEGRWLSIGLDADRVEKEVPPEGVLLRYDFQAAEAGPRELWHRVGYESARAAYEWRLDGGIWTPVSPETPTTDMQELATWNQVAWMRLGGVELSTGPHRLEIRIPRPKDDKGKTRNILYGSDAFALVSGSFRPYGRFKPGEDPRSESDRKAAEHTFAVADLPSTQRQVVPLRGTWEICRDDELKPALVATPMERIDLDPVWTAIQVPGDKAELRPDLSMAHRVWYRTRFTVPTGQGDRSFQLTFHQNSLNTTIYVNGKFCGFNKNPFVKWSCDATSAVKPGVNEVLVGIRDAWYGFEQDPSDPASIRRNFAIPMSFERQGFLHLSYPVWGCFKSGLLDTPELVVGGRVFASDVFVKPSVAKKRLDTELVLKNDEPSATTATVALEAIDAESGEVAASIAKADFPIGAGEEKTVQAGGAWANPTLWWPDRPKMYRLRTTVTSNGHVDFSETPFGFREWTTDGPNYRLNGVVWHGWAELNQGDTPEKWLANYRAHRQRFQRMSGPAQNGSSVRWLGMPYDKALDWCDRNGVVIRRCGPLDGEAIGYMAIEENEALRKKHRTEINQELLDNVRDQMVAQVKGERNHPSVNVWSVENEWLYINTLNLYGGLMDQFERDMKRTVDAVMGVDPTRPAMTDGGGAGKDNILPIHGDHYVFTNEPSDYPALAYGPQRNGGGRGRWIWDGKRPRYAGEDFYASGINPADYAWIQGEEAFSGKTSAHRGEAKVQRMLTEGYRWGGAFTAWHFWIGDEGSQFHDKYISNAERAVFVRQYDWTFGSGQRVTRTLGVFNDSRFDDPMTLAWTLVVGGKTVHADTKDLKVAPGTSQKFDVTLKMPIVLGRASGKLALSLKAGGKEVFRDEKQLSVFPQRAPRAIQGAKGLAVFDPSGLVIAYLQAQKVPFRRLQSLTALPAEAATVVVGPNALSEAQGTDPALAAYAFDGHRVLVLEQAHPLQHQGLPTEIEATSESGAFAFPEDSSHPALQGLREEDLQGWSGHVYGKAYKKPTRGAKSLVEVGPRLSQTALAELSIGKGALLLCQLEVGNHLANGAPAQALFTNMLEYARDYRLVEHPVLSAVSDAHLAGALDGIGVRRTETGDPLKAIAGPAGSVAVISANPANLHKLAANLPKVRAFTQSGGTLVLNGLTPEGLADYNHLVGVEHLIRPFRREKTSLVAPRDPLTLGITQGDVVMYSSERMFDFNNDMFVASDIFSYVVDTDDVAPFAKLPSEYLYNTVNGFVSSDGWKYIYSFDLKSEPKPEYTMEFARPIPLKEMTWVGNGFYHKVKRIALSFDGGHPVAFEVQPNTEPQTLAISMPRTAKTVKLSILDWTREPDISPVVGIDNIYLRAARAADWAQRVKPMLNVGGLVRYPQGKGSIVLANLLFKEKEEVPENATKKRAILGAILRNLKASFSGGANLVIAGAKGIEYHPVSLAGKATGYRNERGWFGDPTQTLKDLPAGHQIFGSVPFDVYDFPTSPVPTAVMLGGPGVPGNLPERVEGIPVNQKASALFFLQTARLDSRRDERQVREGARFEMARYVVTYADGQVVYVPVIAEVDVDDFRQKSPHDLPGARVAWTKPFGTGEQSATAYVMQWANTRTDVPIASLGLEYGKDRRGVPVLLAVTAAK